MSQLFADCLEKVFEYLENDKVSLHSCLLVNRLWCEISVRILWREVLWRNIWKYNSCYDTLISCLPKESKEILSQNGIIISTPKPPMFNYAGFCKVISTYLVYYQADKFLKNQSLKNLSNNHILILAQEIFKLYIKQIPSLRELRITNFLNLPYVHFTSYPEAKGCLKNLSIFHCFSDIDSEYFYHLSQICHNIHSLSINFRIKISIGIADFISAQKSLKYLRINHIKHIKDLTNIIKLPNANTITKLYYHNLNNYNTSLSFITKFTNLQELILKFSYIKVFEDFKSLQYSKFSQLQILKIYYRTPSYKPLVNFLEINGSSLRVFELYNNDSDNSLNLTIAKYCSRLKKLSTGFKKDELETLKMVFNNCQDLESIKIYYDGKYLCEKEALESIAKYSHKNLCEIILYQQCKYNEPSSLLPEELESFFVSWKNRSSQNSLYLVVKPYFLSNKTLDKNYENMKIIEKYIKLGVVKKFEVDTKYDNY